MREFFDYLIVNKSMIELVVLSSIGLTAFIFILMLATKKWILSTSINRVKYFYSQDLDFSIYFDNLLILTLQKPHKF